MKLTSIGKDSRDAGLQIRQLSQGTHGADQRLPVLTQNLLKKKSIISNRHGAISREGLVVAGLQIGQLLQADQRLPGLMLSPRKDKY